MLGTTGQYIWTDSFNLSQHSATIHIESQVRNDSSAPARVELLAQIEDLDGKPVGNAMSGPMTLAPGATDVLTTRPTLSIHFWSWGVRISLFGQDHVACQWTIHRLGVTRTGFRETAFHNGMIYLNGCVIQDDGYATRSTNEWPALGTDVRPWVSDFSNGLMINDNADLVRWMHVTPSKQDVQSCAPDGTDRIHASRRRRRRSEGQRVAGSR